MKSVLRFLVLPLALAAAPVFSQNASDGAAMQSAQADLQSAVKRIAVRPDDADALADAGTASLKLGDPHAALNFFTRANAARPNDARITAGLASATVRTENPFEALRLFDDALKLGIPERNIAADRALAFDLLGNFARAQQDYQLARLSGVTDDLIIHQAVSLSLLGKFNDADGMLVPLLQREVPEAWRARAFMLAARGDYHEADKVAQGFLDADAAEKMDRYFRLMPDLTPAQKSAAIHFGHFPASYDIGHDSEAVRTLAATIPAPAGAQGDARLIPSGKPLGPSKTDDKKNKDKKQASRSADKPVEVAKVAAKKRDDKKATALATQTARDTVANADNAKVAVLKTGELPRPDGRGAGSIAAAARPLPQQAVPTAVQPSSLPPAPADIRPPAETDVKLASEPSMAPQPDARPGGQQAIAAVSGTGAVQGPLPDGTAVSPALASAQQPAAGTGSAGLPPPNPDNGFDLDNVVKSIEVPENEQQPSNIAVDLAAIRQAKPMPVAKPDAKPVVGDPARIWVQVATGAEAALLYDYRALSRKNPELFDGQAGWTSPWSKSSRLLVGPFDSLKEARQWEADFRKAGGDGFVWQSAEGVAVTQIGSSTAKQASRPAVKDATRPAAKAPAATLAKQPAKTRNGKTAATPAVTDNARAAKGTTKGGSSRAASGTNSSAKAGSKAEAAKQATVKTGKRTAKNPAKASARAPGKTAEKGSTKTPAKAPAKTSAKAPTKTGAKADSKTGAKAPAKTSGQQKKK